MVFPCVGKHLLLCKVVISFGHALWSVFQILFCKGFWFLSDKLLLESYETSRIPTVHEQLVQHQM